MLKFINAAVGLVVLVAVWFLFGGYSPNGDIVEKEKGHMSKIIPASPDGWSSKELELGATEEVKRSVEKTLDTSEYINREYTSPDGSKSFVLYISYWGAGKADPKVASAHTPDRCWVLNGWSSDESKMRSDLLFDFDGIKLVPAYYREMKFENNTGKVRRNVCFWHTIDGKRFEYGSKNTLYASLSWNYVRHAFESAFLGAPEQYFIRLDTDMNFDELQKEKAFREVVKSLGVLVLEDKPQPKQESAK